MDVIRKLDTIKLDNFSGLQIIVRASSKVMFPILRADCDVNKDEYCSFYKQLTY